MIYLGLDQALKVSGYSVFQDEKIKACGTIQTNPTSPIEVRLSTIWKHLTILHEKYNFTYVFFEDTQKQVNQDTYKRLCYVQAAVMLWCFYNNVKYNVLSPSHWRKIIKDKYGVSFGRKREEQKKAALEWAEENFFSIKDITEDEADAICIGVAGYLEYNKNRSAF